VEKLAHTYFVRVRYADIDQMGVVYHARYLEWFEAARTEMLRDMGIVYKDLEQSGIYMPVIEVYCRYRKPVRYDELIRVRTVLGELSRSKIRLEYKVQGEKGETVRVEGYTVHCFMDKSGKPRRASQELLSVFQNVLLPQNKM